MGFVEDFRYSLYNESKYIFCPIWNLLCENGNLKRNFSKKNHVQTPNGVLLIFKLPYPNGSYRNGVCRALWALDHQVKKMIPGNLFTFSNNQNYKTKTILVVSLKDDHLATQLSKTCQVTLLKCLNPLQCDGIILTLKISKMIIQLLH